KNLSTAPVVGGRGLPPAPPFRVRAGLRLSQGIQPAQAPLGPPARRRVQRPRRGGPLRQRACSLRPRPHLRLPSRRPLRLWAGLPDRRGADRPPSTASPPSLAETPSVARAGNG